MAGEGYGLPGSMPAGGGVTPTTGVGQATASMQNMAPNSGATTGNSATSTTTNPSNAGGTASAMTAPPGLLQADNSSSGFQLAAPTQGTDMMGTPSWLGDWEKAGSPDLNKWYQQQQGGYRDMSKPLETPAQFVFAPPPPPAAAAAAPAAAATAPPQAQGNWFTPKSGPAPAVTKNSLWGSTPVGQAELDALPDAFVSSQSFLNQYGSSPSAIAYQQWRMGAPAWFGAQNQQNDIRQKMGFAPYY